MATFYTALPTPVLVQLLPENKSDKFLPVLSGIPCVALVLRSVSPQSESPLCET